jgi:hypothetical protein
MASCAIRLEGLFPDPVLRAPGQGQSDQGEKTRRRREHGSNAHRTLERGAERHQYTSVTTTDLCGRSDAIIISRGNPFWQPRRRDVA